MRAMLGAAAVALAIAGSAGSAGAQTLKYMKALDAPHYDGHRTTWGPASDVINMIQSTLVALDWDGKTPIPYLAKSWEVSPDGKLYTFKLREDVQFCSGKKLTAADVVYSFDRQRNPETKAPFAWRAGSIKELRAKDAHTVEYELNEPYSDLLMQLTMFNNAIHNKESVESLGKDYGVKAVDGTGPWCLVSWQPRTKTVLKRHDAYKWGPAMYKNTGPVKFEQMEITIVPEDSARVAAMMGNQFDFTSHIPLQFLTQVRAAPNLQVQEAVPNFQLLYFGFKQNRPMVNDRRVREAMSIAINRAAMVRGIMQGNAEVSTTYVHPQAPDYNPATAGIVKEDVERAKKLLDEAGWKPGPDGIRQKDGLRLEPKIYFTQVAHGPRIAEAIQGDLRKIGIDWKLQGWDSTIAAAKMAEQDYEVWSVTVPYLSAGDLMSLYFDSKNIPAPNRMNWNDKETDEWLRLAKAATNPADRAKYYGLVQKKVTDEHLWIPVMNVGMYLTTNKRMKGARPHMLYQYTFYKGLDWSY